LETSQEQETTVNPQEIRALAAQQREHFALDQAFYRDPDIYRRDIEEIFLKSWLYAGHQSEIPGVGDWFLFEFDEESVIIVRNKDDEINALLNVCRHRGSRVCVESSGCSKRLTCRYHGWTYDLEGRLKAAAQMGENFDKSGIGLKKIHVELLDGMIYVNFAEDPAPFSLIRDGLAECLEPYDLENPTGNWRWKTTPSATTAHPPIRNTRKATAWHTLIPKPNTCGEKSWQGRAPVG
jgi:Rieske 2Fe-2S family protein